MEKQLSHDRLQQEMGSLLWNKYPQTRRTFFHPANETAPYPGESKRDFVLRLAQRKAIWILPGVTDFVWYWDGVLYIFDCKVGKDKVSDPQKEFIAAIVAQGGKFYEIRELSVFATIVDAIIINKPK